MDGFWTKLAVLVAAVKVCPGIHKVRVELGMILKGELALPASYASSTVVTR